MIELNLAFSKAKKITALTFLYNIHDIPIRIFLYLSVVGLSKMFVVYLLINWTAADPFSPNPFSTC